MVTSAWTHLSGAELRLCYQGRRQLTVHAGLLSSHIEDQCIQLTKDEHSREKLTLNFKIFTSASRKKITFNKHKRIANNKGMQDIELGTDEMGLRVSCVNENINQGSNNMNQELLSFLVNDRLLQPLCKHPFVTAFLELHYSFITNIQAYLCLFRLIYLLELFCLVHKWCLPPTK